MVGGRASIGAWGRQGGEGGEKVSRSEEGV